MKKILLIIPALLLTFWLIGTTPASSLKVQFAQSEWEEAQAQAKSQKKLFFVDFDASYCALCRNMDQSTYMDQRLANFMQQNVVALRIDVQDFDGVMWSQLYEVEALPTMLIFDEKGQVVKRLVGYKSANDLLQAFNEAMNGSSQPDKANPNSNSGSLANNTNKAPAQDDQPLLIPERPTPTPPAPAPRPTPTPTPPAPVNTRSTSPSGVSKSLYELSIKQPENEGFTLQVGAYSSYETLLENAQKMQASFTGQRLLMQIEQVNGQAIYRILIGVFATRAQAFSFRDQLQKQGIQAVVRDLKTINL
jgi:thioredoxin-related protein